MKILGLSSSPGYVKKCSPKGSPPPGPLRYVLTQIDVMGRDAALHLHLMGTWAGLSTDYRYHQQGVEQTECWKPFYYLTGTSRNTGWFFHYGGFWSVSLWSLHPDCSCRRSITPHLPYIHYNEEGAQLLFHLSLYP